MTTHATTIAVKHNIEVAHRLYELPGKCEQIHGHSMWVTMELYGHLDDRGILGGIEYGDLKKLFRGYLDTTFDHRLLLNLSDPFARPIYMFDHPLDAGESIIPDATEQHFLPGLQATPGDPTTENIAKWVAEEMHRQLGEAGMGEQLYRMDVTVWETSVNMAKVVKGVDLRGSASE